MSYQIPHPEDFEYHQDILDQSKTMEAKDLQEMIEHLVLEVRGVRRSLRMAMETPKKEPWATFTVIGGENRLEEISNSGITVTVQSATPLRVEVYKLGHEAVLDKLAELPDESK